VTSVLQTTAGKMIFGRVEDSRHDGRNDSRQDSRERSSRAQVPMAAPVAAVPGSQTSTEPIE